MIVRGGQRTTPIAPVEVPYRWQIYIERLDGSYDEYRDCDFWRTRDEAGASAARWAAKHKLPIVVDLLPPKPTNVIPLRAPSVQAHSSDKPGPDAA